MRPEQRIRLPAPPSSAAALRKRLREAGLGRLAAGPALAASESIALVPGRRLSDLTPSAGKSRLGGHPDLPPAAAWPSGRGGKPLAFLGQIRLEDLADFPLAGALPRKGLLWFFADTLRSRGRTVDCAVLHAAVKVSSLRRREAPLDPREGGHAVDILPGHALRFRKAFFPPPAMPAGLSEDEEEAYWNLSHPEAVVHKLLGRADAVQTPPIREKAGEILLLQLDSDPRLDLKWGDNGRLFIAIGKDDLASGDFSRCRAVTQAY